MSIAGYIIASTAALLVAAGAVSGEGVVLEGVECPRIRMDDGREFSLVGADTGKLRAAVGHHIRVTGKIVPFSTCMQGLTLRVETVQILKPDARP
ncbi:DUF5818 domain-containing protein [Jiella avicenniae]|uniref:DUF5818 domain-containing protein n=1 Tax=Jiella avicenniae TaxID=2907202 RepID=A0A9X1P5C9_9HYPH|nr:DUF5818 domain-containing protein [Jiella avicenniae]MCE7029541.1 DUF5818 domain-containing protein [Jiella avicenniae]